MGSPDRAETGGPGGERIHSRQNKRDRNCVDYPTRERRTGQQSRDCLPGGSGGVIVKGKVRRYGNMEFSSFGTCVLV